MAWFYTMGMKNDKPGSNQQFSAAVLVKQCCLEKIFHLLTADPTNDRLIIIS